MNTRSRSIRCFVSTLAVWTMVFIVSPSFAQIRKTPETSKGGEPQGELWQDVPAYFKFYPYPTFLVPDTKDEWTGTKREEVKKILLECLQEVPDRPANPEVKTLWREDRGGYFLEKIQFDNRVDSLVPGYVMIPKNLSIPAPAIIALHGHGSSKESVTIDAESSQKVGESLVAKGYIVAAIDSYFNGERLGTGPGGTGDDKRNQEHSFFKLHMWFGRNLWAMMLRDEQMLLDYLQTRAEVDQDRIGATGMSMGCTRAWWLAAIDERIKSIVGVACFTRYTDLIAHGNLRFHGIYYFVPNILKHFDTEAIFALIAPRPMLMLSGDQDGGAPVSGIEVLEKKVGEVYRLYEQPERFRSVIYKNTGHEYLPEMKEEMLAWFEKHLPVDSQE